jgi:hypothetical protein
LLIQSGVGVVKVRIGIRNEGGKMAYNPKYKSVHSAVSRAECTHRLFRPNKCSKCGQIGRVDGHHEDYDKPLEIIWLCHRCHLQLHFKKVGTGSREQIYGYYINHPGISFATIGRIYKLSRERIRQIINSEHRKERIDEEIDRIFKVCEVTN